jgi:hypothetical protein
MMISAVPSAFTTEASWPMISRSARMEVATFIVEFFLEIYSEKNEGGKIYYEDTVSCCETFLVLVMVTEVEHASLLITEV